MFDASIRHLNRRMRELVKFHSIKKQINLVGRSNLFESYWYIKMNPDLQGSRMSPAEHFIRYGGREFRSPSGAFDTSWYTNKYPDVVAEGVNPLVHYILHGAKEGRSPLPEADPAGEAMPDRDVGGDPLGAKLVHLKRSKKLGQGEWVLFLTHSPWGGLKPHVQAMLHAFRRNGVQIVLIVAADRPTVVDGDVHEMCDLLIVRENIGLDFSAWAHVLRVHPELYNSDMLYLVNDSIVGESSSSSFDSIVASIRSSHSDIVGLTQSFEHGWHVQSYFIALKRSMLASLYLQNFFRGVQSWRDKDAVIQAYEVRLAPEAILHGFSVDVLFKNFDPRNPTLFSWRALLEAGFPFVKILLLRGAYPDLDTDGWRDELARRGFDLCTIDLLLTDSVDLSPAQIGGGRLALAAEHEVLPSAAGDTRVAFYGPWNYDSGLGAASRGAISAIRRAGFQLNLHPVKASFHIHHPVAPAVDICDFEGDADVAIIHLNPDSWHLLAPEQMAAIGRARRRIGYWVWEMDHLPDAWIQNFTAVERIWAPSTYCASVFLDNGAAAVDVIPHVVSLPQVISGQSEARTILERFGLAADARVILFIFDGSSYLVRKNPAALIRAFEASRLRNAGWSLVLKTKHLMDRPKEGAAFKRLAEASPSVVLIDAALSKQDLHQLMMAADIYASPHSSEGFGLTIAEAMAYGKAVVATDYGGSRDFLDDSCGYPVAAHPTRLEEDFGHYTIGGVWGVVDERDLSRSLKKAAEAVVALNPSIGIAARKRIGDRLSAEAVSTQIAASVEAALQMQPRSFLTEWIEPPSSLGGRKATDPPTATQMPVVALKPEQIVSFDSVVTQAERSDNAWILIAPANAHLAPGFDQAVNEAAADRPDVSIFYTDHVALGENTLSLQLCLKPAFDLTLLATTDYIGPAVVVRRDALQKLSGLTASYADAGVVELVLRALKMGMVVDRMPQVLVAYAGKHPAVSAERRSAIVAASDVFSGYVCVAGRTAKSIALRRPFTDHPAVTLLIPTRRTSVGRTSGEGAAETYVERLLDGLVNTSWPMDRLRVIVGDDLEGEPNWAARPWPFRLERVATPRPEGQAFNYAAKMNQLWRAAQTDLLVMLNDDVVVDSPGWLAALMSFAVDESVGGVGGRLRYEDGSLQHAGIVGGLFGVVAHAWLGEPASIHSYQDWAICQREWSMVTGAVFATRRSLMEEVNGFDERFALEFNDIDLCLRLRALGYRIVYNPDADLIHSEKASRGDLASPGADTALFLSRWSPWLSNDPAFNPGLRKDLFDIRPAFIHHAWYRG